MEQVVNASSFGKHPVTAQQCMKLEAAFVTSIFSSDDVYYTYVYHTSDKMLIMLTPIPPGTSVTITYEMGRFF